MAEDKKNTEKKAPVKLDPNRHKGKNFAQIEKETIEDASKIIDQTQNLKDNNVEFKIETNKAGDVEYHRYEDANPNDTDPARLTGIFTQDQMDQAIASRKEDPFYEFNEQTVQPPVIDKDIDMPIVSSPPAEMSGGTTIIAVIGGQPQYIRT